MSRIEYNDECESNFQYLWPSIARRAIKGKRGQEFLKELEAALVALPEKKLIMNELCDKDGQVCVLGAVAVERRVKDGATREDAKRKIHEECWDESSAVQQAREELGITHVLSWEIMHKNDELYYKMTPEQRYKAMLAWVREQIGEARS